MAAANPLDPIPHPPGKPFVGNMLSVDSKAPIQSLLKLAGAYGPIFWLDMMGVPIVFVTSHALVDELCDEKRFDKTVRGALRRVRVLGGDGLFTADTTEPNWAKAHRVLLPPFGGRSMHIYHPMMVDIAQQLVLKWERLNADDEIDVVHDMTALTLDTIGLCGFDYRFNSFYRRDNHPFVEALVRSLETVMMTRGMPLERFTLRGRRRDMTKDLAFLNGMVDEIIKERRAGGSQAEPKKDMLAAMLGGVDKVTGEPLDDVNIRYQINTFLIAGHETTSGLLSYTLYALLKHPDVLAKAYAEVDRVLGPDTAASPTYNQVNQLTYIGQILKEALRLWPPAPAFSLTPLQDEMLAGRYPLKKRAFVNILVGALHRDPAVWGPNPNAFDPENFSREAEAKRPSNAWKPFGNGQRACIGRAFALHEAALALGMILQRFELVDHKRYQMKLKETLTIKPDGFMMRVRPRPERSRGAFVGTGQAGMADLIGIGTARPRLPQHGTPLAILFGSNMGKSEELAHQVADLAQMNGFAVTVAALDDVAGKLPKEGGVLIFCASYNGAPPDNAGRFVAWLSGDLAADAFTGVKYAVFGCGNSDWTATYQAIPRLIDERLSAHGGVRVFERGEGNAREDLDGAFETWFAALRPVAVKALGVTADFAPDTEAEPLYAVEAMGTAAPNPLATSLGAAPVKVLVNEELQTPAEGEHRSTRHIEFELPAGMSYRVGDHLSVVPRNDPALVERTARRFGFTAADQVKLKATPGRRTQLPVGTPVTVGQLLGDFVELQQVATRRQIQTLAAHTRCPKTRPILEALAGEEAERYRAEVFARRRSVVDLLDDHPACELPFGTLLEILPPLAPRYYSISSSPVAAPDRCSVTVAVVSGPALSGRGLYRGTCSNYLAERHPGEVVQASVRETKAGFRLPADPATPLIMIGPGTGLAPFRGFLQERAAMKARGTALGPAMLFFGCRRPEQDFLYADELKHFADEAVCELHVAFSRAKAEKAYVQDLLAAQKDRILDLIGGGAVVYVCGDGAKMEPDVKRTLKAIYSKRSGADEAAAAAWIAELGKADRYVLDVWGG